MKTLDKKRRALLEELHRREIALPAYEDDRRSRDIALARTIADEYQYNTVGYIEDKLGWSPWRGDGDAPGQVEVIEAYELALKQQHERNDWEQGLLTDDQLQFWKPGQTIQNEFRIEAGHTVGKTKLSSGLVNHFFDNFPPAIIYTFAPTWTQIHDLMWKEIKADRRNKGLPGRILDLRLEVSDDHFATGRATNDNGGKGTEKTQGQHGKYLMFVLDEAEGVPDFVWGAVDSMLGGGIAIVLMLANPKTRASKFYKRRLLPTVKSFRISCLGHPNVLKGREVVPGAVRRGFVEKMMQSDDAFVEIVTSHDPDEHTFTLPYPVTLQGVEWAAGTIFKPGGQFCWRVLGIPPKNATVNTFVPAGRYDAAAKRAREDASKRGVEPLQVRCGVDVARFGDDFGTLYIEHDGAVWRAAQFWKDDTSEYVGTIREHLIALHDAAPDEAKPNDLEIRVDGSGGFGAGVVDGLKHDPELKKRFYRSFNVIETQFGGAASDPTKYANLVSEMYGEAAESIKGLAIVNAPAALEDDLCERTYKFVNVAGVSVKMLSPKDEFKKLKKRSPDDGDGFVLCVAPDFVFEHLRPLVLTVY